MSNSKNNNSKSKKNTSKKTNTTKKTQKNNLNKKTNTNNTTKNKNTKNNKKESKKGSKKELIKNQEEDLVIVDGVVIEENESDNTLPPKKKDKKKNNKNKKEINKETKKENNKDKETKEKKEKEASQENSLEDSEEPIQINEEPQKLSWFEKKKLEHEKQKEEHLKKEINEIKETKTITTSKVIKKIINFIKTLLKLIIISIIITTILLFFIVKYLRSEATDNRFGYKDKFISETLSAPLENRFLYEPNNINYYVLQKSASSEKNAKKILLDYLIESTLVKEEDAENYTISFRHETEYCYMYLLKVNAIPNNKCYAFFIWKDEGLNLQTKEINLETINKDSKKLRELLDLYLFLKDGNSSKKYLYSKLSKASNNVYEYNVYYTYITHDNGGINLIHLAKEKFTINLANDNTLYLENIVLDESKDILIIDEE